MYTSCMHSSIFSWSLVVALYFCILQMVLLQPASLRHSQWLNRIPSQRISSHSTNLRKLLQMAEERNYLNAARHPSHPMKLWIYQAQTKQDKLLIQTVLQQQHGAKRKLVKVRACCCEIGIIESRHKHTTCFSPPHSASYTWLSHLFIHTIVSSISCR